jgi:hypothetical protein
MTLADYSLAAFALLNGGRTVAYFPQMIRVYRDPHGAAAVSLLTWLVFAAANLATVGYALTAADDRIIATVFALNAIGCLAIVALTAFKRVSVGRRRTRRWTSRSTSLGHLIESLRQSQTLVDLVKVGRACCSRHDTPSARHRDDMIRQGLMS